MTGYVGRVKKGVKDVYYLMRKHPGAVVSALGSMIPAAAYRIIIGNQVKSHPEVGINPINGKPCVIGGTTGDLFNSWWNPGWNGENYVPGDSAHGLSAHDKLIYNTTTGAGGFFTGLAFTIAAGVVGLSAYLGVRKVINLFSKSDKEKLAQHHEKRSKLIVGEKKQTLDDVVTA